MGLFKSKDERKLDQEIRIKQGLTMLKRSIAELEKQQGKYIEYAKRARRLGDNDQYSMVKSVLKQTLAGRRMRERQLLHIETAMAIRDQAEADVNFAKSMQEVSKAIEELCGSINLSKVQLQYEKALTESETLKEKMEIFVDTATQRVTEGTTVQEEEIVKDEEIEKMLEEETVRGETAEFDKQIETGLDDIKKQLEKDEH